MAPRSSIQQVVTPPVGELGLVMLQHLVWSAVRGPWSMVCGPWSVVRGPWSVVRGLGLEDRVRACQACKQLLPLLRRCWACERREVSLQAGPLAIARRAVVAGKERDQADVQLKGGEWRIGGVREGPERGPGGSAAAGAG